MLFRGGRLEAELWLFEFEVDGEGVWLPLLGAADIGVGRRPGELLPEGVGAECAGPGGSADTGCSTSVAISGFQKV